MHGVVDSSALRLNVPTIGAGTCRWGGSSVRLTLQRS
jgi:hypothetical protein